MPSTRRPSGGHSLFDADDALTSDSTSIVVEQQSLISRNNNNNSSSSNNTNLTGEGGNNGSRSTTPAMINNNSNSNTSTTPSKMTGTPGRRRGRAANKANSANAFNPTLIFSQILAVQCFHYFISGIIMEVNNILFGTSVCMDRLFTARYLDLRSVPGWIDNGSILLSYVIGYVSLLWIDVMLFCFNCIMR
jgi:hypothetical protein